MKYSLIWWGKNCVYANTNRIFDRVLGNTINMSFLRKKSIQRLSYLNFVESTTDTQYLHIFIVQKHTNAHADQTNVNRTEKANRMSLNKTPKENKHKHKLCALKSKDQPFICIRTQDCRVLQTQPTPATALKYALLFIQHQIFESFRVVEYWNQ